MFELLSANVFNLDPTRNVLLGIEIPDEKVLFLTKLKEFADDKIISLMPR